MDAGLKFIAGRLERLAAKVESDDIREELVEAVKLLELMELPNLPELPQLPMSPPWDPEAPTPSTPVHCCKCGRVWTTQFMTTTSSGTSFVMRGRHVCG